MFAGLHIHSFIKQQLIMKTSFLVALFVLIAATALFSCDWFSGKSNQNKATSVIEGKWQIDSVDIKNDSSIVGWLAFSVLGKDSTLQVRFSKDSAYFNTGEHSAFSINEKQLLIQQDSIPHRFNWSKTSDTTLLLVAEDSTNYFLRKINE